MTTTYIVRFTEATGKPWRVHVNAKDEAEAIAIVQDRYRWAVNIEVFPR